MLQIDRNGVTGVSNSHRIIVRGTQRMSRHSPGKQGSTAELSARRPRRRGRLQPDDDRDVYIDIYIDDATYGRPGLWKFAAVKQLVASIHQSPRFLDCYT